MTWYCIDRFHVAKPLSLIMLTISFSPLKLSFRVARLAAFFMDVGSITGILSRSRDHPSWVSLFIYRFYFKRFFFSAYSFAPSFDDEF